MHVSKALCLQQLVKTKCFTEEKFTGKKTHAQSEAAHIHCVPLMASSVGSPLLECLLQRPWCLFTHI